MTNPLHDVDLGQEFPRLTPAIVEVPKGSKIKYEIDKQTGLIRVDRVLFSAVHYPANYGFIPQTLCEDGDALDILVLGLESVVPLAIMNAKPIGVMKMRDQAGEDDKIISVHANDPEYANYSSMHELPPHRLTEIQRFFEDYKVLERKTVKIKSFGDQKEAWKVMKMANQEYLKHQPKLKRA